MNRRVWWVLRDYVGRTLGLWLLVLLAQFVQSAAFWAAGIPRIPLLGAVIASFAYMALAEKPHSALRTLPLTDTDGAVIRWWGTFGLPVVVMGIGIALAASLSAYKGRTVPFALWPETCMAISIAALAWLTAIERAFGRWGTKSASGYVAIVWVTLTIVAIVGLPIRVLSAPILCLIFVGSLCLSAGACLAASRSVRMSQSREPRDRVLAPSWPRSRFSLRPAGWMVMVFEVGRTTAIVSVAALITATIIQRTVAPWAQTGLHGLVIWLVVSATAVAAGLSMRRWVEAIYSLRILPITGYQLVLALYLAMIFPGVFACLALSTAQHFSPSWGLDIPGYMLVVFLPAPVTRPQELRQVMRAFSRRSLPTDQGNTTRRMAGLGWRIRLNVRPAIHADVVFRLPRRPRHVVFDSRLSRPVVWDPLTHNIGESAQYDVGIGLKLPGELIRSYPTAIL